MTNHFPFSVRTNFHIDYPEGGLRPHELINTRWKDNRHMCGGINDLEHARYDFEYVEELQEELLAKTEQLEGELPTEIYFYFVPSIGDPLDSFELCALTKVSNNGTVNLFAPKQIYLTIYQSHDDIVHWDL